jgi:nicotinamide-nucleotide amidase
MKEAGALIREFAGKGLRIATAESCTGGLIAASLTDIAGSSDVFERGFVAYSNEAKIELLGVPAALIDKHGAVSEEVAGAMSAGALAHSPADVAIAVTGIAGPGGGTAEKPVGLVYVAAAQRGGGQSVQRHLFDGGRESVRLSAVRAALALALSLVAS